MIVNHNKINISFILFKFLLFYSNYSTLMIVADEMDYSLLLHLMFHDNEEMISF